MNNNMNLHNILFDNKLTGSNFMDWVQNLRIILIQEKLFYVLENSIPSEPAPDDDVAVKDAYHKHSDDYESICCLMLASMSPDLQKQYEDMNAFTMLNHLKALYDKRVRNERYDISQELFHCKMEVGSSVATHVLKMIGLIEKLEKLGFMLHHQLSVDLTLQFLPPSFSNFVMNFNLTQLETSTLPELLNMLKTAKDSIRKEKGYVLMVEPSKKSKFKFGPKKTIKKAFKPTYQIKKEKKPKGTCMSPML